MSRFRIILLLVLAALAAAPMTACSILSLIHI